MIWLIGSLLVLSVGLVKSAPATRLQEGERKHCLRFTTQSSHETQLDPHKPSSTHHQTHLNPHQLSITHHHRGSFLNSKHLFFLQELQSLCRSTNLFRWDQQSPFTAKQGYLEFPSARWYGVKEVWPLVTRTTILSLTTPTCLNLSWSSSTSATATWESIPAP